MSDVHVLVGPEAGRGRAAGTAADVLDRLRALGSHVIDLTGPTADRSTANAREAIAAGAERLVVLGGDGMIHLALQTVAGTETILGVVPVGTGNDFVRALPGIPDDPLDAAAVALGDPRPIDAIKVGDRWVASVATAGFSADVNARANTLSHPKGQSRYTVATILELPGLRGRAARITADDDVGEYEAAAMIAVANTAWFGGGMHICPDADPDDGLLDVTVVDGVGRIELLRFFNRVFKGTHLTHRKVHTHRGRRIEIEGDFDLWGDGEPVGPTSTVLEAVPAAIRLAR